MKLIVRFFTLSILAVGVGFAFFVKIDNGRPTLALPDVSGVSLPDLPDMNTARVTTSYKWQDEKGRWHYGDTPPENLPFTELQVSNQTNIIQSLSDADRAKLAPPETLSVAANPPTSVNAQPAPSSENSELGLSQALNVLNDAKAVRAQMEARNSAMDGIVNGQR